MAELEFITVSLTEDITQEPTILPIAPLKSPKALWLLPQYLGVYRFFNTDVGKKENTDLFGL